MKIIVSFSGGKDSQACLIQAANKYGVDKIEAVFCDTGWEHPDTYQHISNVCKQLDVRLIILRSKKYTDFWICLSNVPDSRLPKEGFAPLN